MTSRVFKQNNLLVNTSVPQGYYIISTKIFTHFLRSVKGERSSHKRSLWIFFVCLIFQMRILIPFICTAKKKKTKQNKQTNKHTNTRGLMRVQNRLFKSRIPPLVLLDPAIPPLSESSSRSRLGKFEKVGYCLNPASRYQFQNYPASHQLKRAYPYPAKIFPSRIPPSIFLVSPTPPRFWAPSRPHPAKSMLDIDRYFFVDLPVGTAFLVVQSLLYWISHPFLTFKGHAFQTPSKTGCWRGLWVRGKKMISWKSVTRQK